MDILALILAGWPAVISSVVLTSVGISKSSWRIALAGVLLAIPFTVYLSLTPRFGWLAPGAGLLYGCVPLAVQRRWTPIAVLLALPFWLVVISLAAAVLEQ